MALRNGLLIHGPTHWAAAIRTAEGRIEVGSGPKPVFAPGAAGRVPGLRGPLKLVEAFAVLPLVRRSLPNARLPFEHVKVLAAMGVATVAGSMLRRGATRTSATREAAAAAIGLLPAMVALRDGELAAYHGVEHKAIGAYEQGLADASEASKEHERCGSNLVAPMLGFSIAGQVILERLLERPGPAARGAVAVASVSAAVELFAWGERHGDSAAGKAFHRPGHELQRVLATREPSQDQLEVGSAALAEIIRVEAA